MRSSNMGILPYSLPYYGHLGASCSSSIAVRTLLIGVMPKFIWSLGGSCSNIGRIWTKENIVVGTLLIGTLPNSLGASWSYSNHSLTPFESDLDRIRIRVIKNLSRSFGGCLFKHRSYSNQREHSYRYPLDRHNAKATGGYIIVFESEASIFSFYLV